MMIRAFIVGALLSTALLVSAGDCPDSWSQDKWPDDSECPKIGDARGSFTDGSVATANYDNCLNKCWFITPEMGEKDSLSLNFDRFDVEAGYDFVHVWDFAKNEWLTNEAKGNDKFVSKGKGGGFYVWFTTDYSERRNGFEISFAKTGAEEDEETVATPPPEAVVFDFHEEDNCASANTCNYHQDANLVTRRGTQVKFTVQGTNPEEFIFSLQGDEGEIRVKPRNQKGGFKVSVVSSSNGRDITVTDYSVVIELAVDMAIGEYVIQVKSKGVTYGNGRSIFVCFNPFNEADETYTPNEADRNAYLLSDKGYAYYGSVKSQGRMAWGYDQFKATNYRTVFGLLKGLGARKRKSAVLVSRWLTWKGNSEVLYGRWDGEYDDGKKPGYWKDTSSILDTFRDTGDMVKYGQCWVFSSLYNTMARAVGITTRGLTNYGSAHEHPFHGQEGKPWSGFDQTIDEFYYVKDGYLRRDKDQPTDDSTWNFHVWNEIMLKRPDVTGIAGFDGDTPSWNMVDATCQEESDGKCQMGPAPIDALRIATTKAYDQHLATLKKAVKDGEFGSSETYAYKCWWVKTTDAKYKADENKFPRGCEGRECSYYYPHSCETGATGPISMTHGTNGLSLDRAKDYAIRTRRARIYAHAVEGKKVWNPQKMFKAVSSSSFMELSTKVGANIKIEVNKPEDHDVDITVEMLETDGAIQLGKDASYKFKFQKTRQALGERTVMWSIQAFATSYRGGKDKNGKTRDFGKVYGQTGSEVLTTRAQKEIAFTIKQGDYLKYLSKTNSFRVEFTATVKETEQKFLGHNEDLVLVPPQVTAKDPQSSSSDFSMEAGSSTDITWTFHNPLAIIPLKNCQFSGVMSGGCALKTKQEKQNVDLLAGNRKMTLKTTAKCGEEGVHEAIMTVSCKGILPFSGSAKVTVSKGAVKEAPIATQKPTYKRGQPNKLKEIGGKVANWAKNLMSALKDKTGDFADKITDIFNKEDSKEKEQELELEETEKEKQEDPPSPAPASLAPASPSSQQGGRHAWRPTWRQPPRKH